MGYITLRVSKSNTKILRSQRDVLVDSNFNSEFTNNGASVIWS